MTAQGKTQPNPTAKTVKSFDSLMPFFRCFFAVILALTVQSAFGQIELHHPGFDIIGLNDINTSTEQLLVQMSDSLGSDDVAALGQAYFVKDSPLRRKFQPQLDELRQRLQNYLQTARIDLPREFYPNERDLQNSFKNDMKFSILFKQLLLEQLEINSSTLHSKIGRNFSLIDPKPYSESTERIANCLQGTSECTDSSGEIQTVGLAMRTDLLVGYVLLSAPVLIRRFSPDPHEFLNTQWANDTLKKSADLQRFDNGGSFFYYRQILYFAYIMQGG